MSGFLCYLVAHLFIFLTLFAPLSASLSWPSGSYGLPMPMSGCPKSNFTWKTGWRFQDTEDKNPGNGRSSVLHIEGLVRESSVNRSFCMKTSVSGTDAPRWPQGEYCIYKAGNTCPRGLQDGQVKWDDEDSENQNNQGGTLPRGTYQNIVPGSTVIEYCCGTSGSKTSPIDLPVGSPFYLLAYDSKQCQQAKWAVATSEWIHYDTENDNNADYKLGFYPYGAKGGVDGHTIYYCYYTSCKYVLNNTSGILQSPFFPLKYPNGQLCSWSIIVHPNQTIQLRFTHFSLNKTTNQRDVLQIYDGKDDKGRMIGSFHGDNLPGDVTSSSNNLFVVFQSDSAGKDKGFRAEYQAVNTQDPFTTSTTAVTSSNPSTTTTTAMTSSNPSTTTTTAMTSSNPSPNTTTFTVMSSPPTPGITSFSTTSSTNKTSLARKACLQKSVAEIPVASIVIPVIICLAAVIVVAIVLYWRWREKRRAKEEKNPSMRYQVGAVNNPAYFGTVIKDTPDPDADRSSVVLKDEEPEDIYQEVHEHQMDNPLYESTDKEPIVSGNILYDSIASKSQEDFHDELS